MQRESSWCSGRPVFGSMPTPQMKWRGSESHFISLRSERDTPSILDNVFFLIKMQSDFVKKKKKINKKIKKITLK